MMTTDKGNRVSLPILVAVEKLCALASVVGEDEADEITRALVHRACVVLAVAVGEDMNRAQWVRTYALAVVPSGTVKALVAATLPPHIE